jgi:hypothetical protein
MARLPNPGGDDGTWGNLLNDFLSQAHNADGTLKPLNESQITNLTADLAAKASSASLAPVATSGSYADLTSKPTIPTTAADVGAVSTSGLDAATAGLVTSGSSTTSGALRAAFDAVYDLPSTAAARSAANADHAAAFGRIQKLFLGPPSGTYLARSANDYTLLLGLGSGRYAAWLLPRLAQSLNSVTYTLNNLNGCAIQIPMVSVDDTAGTYAGTGTWTNNPMTSATDPGYKAVPITVTTTSGSLTINYTGGPLTTADTGRRALIPGAGAGGADLNTSIGSITGSTFTVGTAPSASLTGVAATILTGYRYNPTAGGTASWTTPASTTAIAVGIVTAQNGGLGKVTIDGDATLANLLPTAQQVVDSGRYANTILIANGGTLNPTDRVIDYYRGAAVTNYNVLRALGEGLAAGAHAVVITGSGYQPTGGTGTRIYIDRWASATAATTPTTSGAAMFTAFDMSAGFASAWEYAIECHPVSGSTWTFIGQTAHQYEDQQTLTVYLDDAVATPADGTITVCNSAQIVRTTKLYHPDSGASLASPPIATASVTYRLDRNGLTVTPTITFAVDTVVRTAYVMLPMAGPSGIPTKIDRAALEASAAVYSMTASGNRYGFTRSAFGWAWNSTGHAAACIYVPDHWGFTEGYAATVQGSQVEDRSGTVQTTKLYFPWVGVNLNRTFKAGESKTYTARYMAGYFADANASLAAA